MIIGVNYYYGKGCAVNYSKAMKYYIQSADKGNPDAQNNLGRWYFILFFSQSYNFKKMNIFLMLFIIIGVMYQIGQGCAIDNSKAMRYYQRAADQGYTNAQFNLGIFAFSLLFLFNFFFLTSFMFY